MKSVLLIGLGRFGRHMAQRLHDLHHEVLAVDMNEDRVNAALPYVTNAQIGDATNEQFVASLGVRNFDLCVVTVGDNFQSSLEATALLKEYGAPLWWPGPPGMSMPSSSCAMVRTTSSTRKSRWAPGQLCAIPPTTSSTT